MSKRKTKADRQAEIDRVHGKGRYLIIGGYRDALTPVDLLCLACGHKWSASVTNVCRKTGRAVTHAEIQASIDKTHGRGSIKLLDTYTRSSVPHRAHCGRCGNIWKVKPNNLQSGRGCPKCARNRTVADVIYIWVSDQWLNGNRVYKIGVTGCRSKLDRVVSVMKKSRFNGSLLAKEVVWCGALELEKKLLMIGDDPGYSGFDGATEFRALDDRQLSVVLSMIKDASAFSMMTDKCR